MSKPVIPRESPLGMYGSKLVFTKLFGLGYTKVFFGSGEWIGDKRIVAIWVFFRSDDASIATYEHHKSRDETGTSIRARPLERELSKDEYAEMVKQNKIVFATVEPTDLKEIVEHYS